MEIDRDLRYYCSTVEPVRLPPESTWHLTRYLVNCRWILKGVQSQMNRGWLRIFNQDIDGQRIGWDEAKRLWTAELRRIAPEEPDRITTACHHARNLLVEIHQMPVPIDWLRVPDAQEARERFSRGTPIRYVHWDSFLREIARVERDLRDGLPEWAWAHTESAIEHAAAYVEAYLDSLPDLDTIPDRT